MTTSPRPEALYLHDDGEPVFAVFHAPAPGTARDTAVLLCPPFGWDEVSSYRARRAWAQRLAVAGFPALRVSLPGTGDSGGAARDPERLQAWTEAVRRGAASLLQMSAAEDVTAVGMGLGAAIAYRAVAAGAPIDDLVLWAAPTRGREFVRELRAFSRLESSRFFEGLEQPAPLPEGEIEAGGFLLSAETILDLGRLDLSSLPLPDAHRRRVLLLERDGIPVDPRLHDGLCASGAVVSTAPGHGYADITFHPQSDRVALDVLDRVMAWLDANSTRARAGSHPGVAPPATAQRARIRLSADTHVYESPVTFDEPFGALSGILTEPSDDRHDGLCAVLLNPGAVRRIGPNRMWVETARRWAAAGVPTLRLDLEGIGEADGEASRYVNADKAFYSPTLVPQVLRAIDHLQERGIGERFLLAGLCSGAYWSFEGARRDDRVQAAVMLNPGALVWDADLAPARDFRALITGRASLDGIRREANPARVGALARWLLAAPRRRALRLLSAHARAAASGADLALALRELHAAGKRLTFVFSAQEAFFEELVSSGQLVALERSPSVVLERIAVRDHTLRPQWAQHQAHQALDRALEREIAIGHVVPTPETTARVSSEPVG